MSDKPVKIFMPILLLVLAYEWLTSGLNKILDSEFIEGLHKEMLEAIPEMKYQFYARFLEKYCVEHCTLFAWLVEIGEILAGIAFLILAAAFLRGRISRTMMKAGTVTALAAAFMNLNFLFYEGGSFFLFQSEAFDEGISIDFLLFLIQLGVAAYFYIMLSEDKGKGGSASLVMHG